MSLLVISPADEAKIQSLWWISCSVWENLAESAKSILRKSWESIAAWIGEDKEIRVVSLSTSYLSWWPGSDVLRKAMSFSIHDPKDYESLRMLEGDYYRKNLHDTFQKFALENNWKDNLYEIATPHTLDSKEHEDQNYITLMLVETFRPNI